MKRQGDLLIISIPGIPPSVHRKEDLLLAEGEMTGHKHILTDGIVYEKKATLYFSVAQTGSILVHPEHHPITFQPGTYRVIPQREYIPGSWRYVED